MLLTLMQHKHTCSSRSGRRTPHPTSWPLLRPSGRSCQHCSRSLHAATGGVACAWESVGAVDASA